MSIEEAVKMMGIELINLQKDIIELKLVIAKQQDKIIQLETFNRMIVKDVISRGTSQIKYD